MKTIIEALEAFPRYMNRPLARVQVYSWRVACLIEPANATGHGIRVLPAYRSMQDKELRRSTAGAIRIARKGGRIKLPFYTEAAANYIWP